MKIDPVRLNEIVNKLKGLVGEQGVFVLFLAKPNGESGEDMQIRLSGPNSRIVGLHTICGGYLDEFMAKRMTDLIRPMPNEPD